MKENNQETVKENKYKQEYIQEDIKAILKDSSESETSNWWIIIFLILTSFGFNRKTDRETLIEKVNESDLSKIEKKQIIDILLG